MPLNLQKRARYQIELPKSSTEHAKKKNAVRQSQAWKDLRETIKKQQKVDALTGSRLTKDYNCHHMDMNPDNYDNMDPSHFVGLNKLSHTVVHFFAEMKDWRKGITALQQLLEQMEQLSDGDIHAR